MKLISSKLLSFVKFGTFFRDSLARIGFIPADLLEGSGPSIKLGSIQRYRLLDLRDENIMERVLMTGPNAYRNYCPTYKDCSPKQLPGFCTTED